MAKKYVPNGVYLVCDKGLGFGKLKVTNHKNVRLYGKQMATEGDKVPMVNIPCLGICSITKTKCQPIPLLWQGVQQGITIGPYHKLLEDSKLPCSLGGKIGIHFSMPAAMAAIEANVTAMRQREMKSLGAKVDDWFQKGFDDQEKANNKVGGLYGKYANFKLGVNEGIYGGVKGIGEGLVFLKEMGDKARGAALHAVTHSAETAGKVKDAAVATKNAVSGAADWVSTPGNVKKVASDIGQAHINAYNWATTPGNLENAGKAAITKTGEGLTQAKDWASKQSPRDWGRYTGRTGFEVGLMFTGVGEAKAVVSGAELANVAAKTGEGANILAKTAEAARAAKIAEEANATAKALEVAKAAEEAKKARTLGEVVSAKADDVIELAPGTKGNWNKILNNKLKPNSTYKVGNKLYETDEFGRIKRVKGEIELGKLGRNGYQQGKSVILKDGTKGIDEGGHLIGHQFKGAGEQINYVPMKGTLNQGAWKKMESDWAKALKEVPPKKVEVDIKNIYDGVSKRPSKFKVIYKIDGKTNIKIFPNN